MDAKLNFYLTLPWVVEVRPLTEEEGGGFLACIPLLGRNVIVADGETIEEALKTLEEIKVSWFTKWLLEGKSIPIPKPDSEDFGGKILVRVPKDLHRDLAVRSREEGVSLNQYIQHLLSKGVTFDSLESMISASSLTIRRCMVEWRAMIDQYVKPKEFLGAFPPLPQSSSHTSYRKAA